MQPSSLAYIPPPQVRYNLGMRPLEDIIEAVGRLDEQQEEEREIAIVISNLQEDS